MKHIPAATVSTAAFVVLFAVPSYAAAFSSLNSDNVKFNANTSETSLLALGAASISFGSTNIYIGTNQVSGNNQNPIVTSFTNGVRDWVQSYDDSPIDGRGIGLLWDEDSSNLYGVFTADGGSNGADTFGQATQGGWLAGYGPGSGAKASVLLKLDPTTGDAEAGTFIRAQLSSGNTNTVNPTGLDYVDDQVVFFGDSFFTPLDTDGQPLENRDPDAGSPFPYRVVLTPDLSDAISAESIGFEGVTQFSPLDPGSGNGGGDGGSNGGGDGGSNGGGDGGSNGGGDGGSNGGGDGGSNGGGDGGSNGGGDGGSNGGGDGGSNGGGDGGSNGGGDGGSNGGGDGGGSNGGGDGGSNGGGDGGSGGGDGGSGDPKSIPEPGTVLGLTTLVAAGIALRKRGNSPSV
ncbi:MAG: PEP-CTERM sorting domain-containing protein [Cyanobacteria bacterium J06638_28]